jgi:NADH:ubiquinone oxidoreductase subunit F (NADH-binding)
VVVLSDKDSARDAALNMLRFFEDESCGQCTPCRVGCEKAVKLMQAERWDQPLLTELCDSDGRCLDLRAGQAAPNPIRTVMTHFKEDVS